MTNPTTAPAPAAAETNLACLGAFHFTLDAPGGDLACSKCGESWKAAPSAPAAAGQTQQEHQTEVIAVGEGWCQARCTCGWFDQYVVPARLRASAEYAATCHLRIVGASAAPAPTPEPQGEAERLRGVIERDRTAVAETRTRIGRVLSGFEWATEGRGPYEWDDERYREEFGRCLSQLRAAVEPLERIGGDLSDCPTDSVAVSEARRGMASVLAAPPAAAPTQREQALREALERLRAAASLARSFVGVSFTDSEEYHDRKMAALQEARDAEAAADAALAASPSREEGRIIQGLPVPTLRTGVWYPTEDYHEDYGPVLWINPGDPGGAWYGWLGSSDQPEEFSHWTPVILPDALPTPSREAPHAE